MVSAAGIKQDLMELSLREFLEKTNRERPEITGGCVLLTNSGLTAAMVLMALKITLKRTDGPAQKRQLKQQIKSISILQTKLVDAAAKDLQVFDEYRKVLMSRSKNRQIRLDQALEHATDSLLGVCKTLHQAIANTEACKALVHSTVLSDLNAGQLIFEATFAALMALAEGNIKAMPSAAQSKYERWKESLQSA